MNEHFDRILSTTLTPPTPTLTPGPSTLSSSSSSSHRGDRNDDYHDHLSYIRASKFEGKKIGYKFHLGPHGLGYYYDKYQQQQDIDKSTSESNNLIVSLLRIISIM